MEALEIIITEQDNKNGYITITPEMIGGDKEYQLPIYKNHVGDVITIPMPKFVKKGKK